MYEASSSTFDPVLILTYVPRWPLIVFAISACFCLGSSAAFHLFQIHSKFLNEFLSRLDYGGICLLIMGSSYPPIFYPFACEEVYGARNFFLALITFTCSAAFIACMLPAMAKPEWRGVRGSLFILLGISAAAPMFYL
jgi:adiponectin receptor